MYDETIFNALRRIEADIDAYGIVERLVIGSAWPCEITLEYDFFVSLKIDMWQVNSGAFYAPFIIKNTKFRVK